MVGKTGEHPDTTGVSTWFVSDCDLIFTKVGGFAEYGYVRAGSQLGIADKNEKL